MPEATIRTFRIVRQEGQRQVGRIIEHYAEDQTRRRQQVFLRDWQTKLAEFLRFNDRAVLPHAGSISKKEADAHAAAEYQSFQERRRQLLEAEAQRDDVKQLEDVDKSADKTDSNEAE